MNAMLYPGVMGKMRGLMFLTCLLPARVAFAQNDPVAAEALFQQGRSLLDAGKIAEACPKLAESHRLDPATGTLIALALCHQADGKLASAWAEFVEAEGRARKEGSKDREAVAHEQAMSLYPRLSNLTLEVPPDIAAIPGLEIKRDGIVLGRGAWGTTVPIDGGEHVIEATAPGKQPWSSKITVRAESEQVRLSVPALLDTPPAPAAVRPTPAQSEPQRDLAPPAESNEQWGGLEWTGIGMAVAGGAALGLGGYFLSDALDKKDQADSNCSRDNECNEAGLRERDQAVASGNKATLLSIAGGVLVAGGGALFLVGRLGGSETSDDARASLFVGIGPGSAALRLERRF